MIPNTLSCCYLCVRIISKVSFVSHIHNCVQVLAKQSIKASNNQPERARRKQRVQWTEQEEKYLKEGVALLGTGQWRHIIAAYPFHPSRNGDSLRDKYRHNILPGMKKVKHH